MKKFKVPFIDYPKAYLSRKPEIDAALFGCIEQGNLVYRKEHKEFEERFAKFCGVKHAIGTGSCTGAMFLSLKALGIGPGDEVITVAHTYVATIDVIVATGATPILVDVEWDSMNMDTSLLEAAITTSTKAIMPVHLNGRMCDMNPIMEIAKKRGLYVIEDAAQAVGAHCDGKPSGSFGETGCFSFYPAKILGWFGEGGAIVTDDEERASLLYLLRDHGEWPPYLGSKKGEIFGWGYNSILDNIAAAVLSVKMKYLPATVSRRRAIAGMYENELGGIQDLFLPYPPKLCEKYYDSFQNYVIRVDGSTNRDKLQDHLTGKGIETLVHWRTPNHEQKGLPSLNKYDLLVTEQISARCLSLPMYPELAGSQVSHVAKAVRSFFR